MNFLQPVFEEVLKAIGGYSIAFIRWILGGCKKTFKSYLNYESGANDLLGLLITFVLLAAIGYGIFSLF